MEGYQKGLMRGEPAIPFPAPHVDGEVIDSRASREPASLASATAHDASLSFFVEIIWEIHTFHRGPWGLKSPKVLERVLTEPPSNRVLAVLSVGAGAIPAAGPESPCHVLLNAGFLPGRRWWAAPLAGMFFGVRPAEWCRKCVAVIRCREP